MELYSVRVIFGKKIWQGGGAGGSEISLRVLFLASGRTIGFSTSPLGLGQHWSMIFLR